ncbi:heavy-metal-associated domain-containing protein [Cryobacterium aureum]|uniref:heavy-metal-associated domain-containing protein n=1 Tax=Cryobacterium aureum TaxID=995037 RepID=UPI0023E82589|nr:heavy-metal-associated domain-containing protein [Cryobacterium aureum]
MSHTYEVSGMTCGHCVFSVTEEVSRVDGVKNVDVQLIVGGASRVTVSSTDALDHEAVAAAIDEAGYALMSVPRKAVSK